MKAGIVIEIACVCRSRSSTARVIGAWHEQKKKNSWVEYVYDYFSGARHYRTEHFPQIWASMAQKGS